MRSRTTRELAERALARLALCIGDHGDGLTVIGGLNADLLTDPQDPPHQGTLDVDLLIQVGFVFDRDELDFRWLEAALTAAAFVPLAPGSGWRWRTTIDGVPVVLDVLCDTADNPGQEIALPGTATVTAKNVAGPAPAMTDVIPRDLPVTAEDLTIAGLPSDGRASVRVRFAGLGGYVLAKAAAQVGRSEARDAYDLAFVLLHNRAGGPEAAARAASEALSAVPQGNHLGTLRASLRAFASADDDAPRAYARQRSLDGDDVGEDILAQDAVAAALACLAELDRLSEERP